MNKITLELTELEAEMVYQLLNDIQSTQFNYCDVKRRIEQVAN